MKVIIIGGVAGGASAATRLRRLDEKAVIKIFEKSGYVSFANCGLPYHIGDVISNRENLLLETPGSFSKKFNIDVSVNSEVKSIDRINKRVIVKNLLTGEEFSENYDKLIISTGTSPFIPPIEGLDKVDFLKLRNIEDMDYIKEYIKKRNPKRAVVIGGGFIGLEIAENLVHKDIDVTVIERAEQVMTPVDFEIAAHVHQELKKNNVALYLKEEVKQVIQTGDKITVKLSGTAVETDMLIVSIGVKPESELARKAGISLNERGYIPVNEYMATNDENIFAVGDVTETELSVSGKRGTVPLASPANKQGRIAASSIAGKGEAYKGTAGTSIVKIFSLAVAATGLNEKSLKREGFDYRAVTIVKASHASYYPGASDTLLKVLFNPDTGKIYGAQAVGREGVDKKIDVIATAIYGNISVFDLGDIDFSYAPPFNSAKDIVNYAGFMAKNIVFDKTEQVQWNELEGKLLIDVRTPEEYELGHIRGALNIPLDKIREQLSRLDKKKEYVVYCKSGLRGYNAQRILMSYGFKVVNLNGGISIYNMATGEQENRITFTETDRKKEDSGNSTTDDKTDEYTYDLTVDACGLQCPGPILKVRETLENMNQGEILLIRSTDASFEADIKAWTEKTGNVLLKTKNEKGVISALIKKVEKKISFNLNPVAEHVNKKSTLVVFSEDFDKIFASLIIANGSLAMGNEVSMFFTFWGLNCLRKENYSTSEKKSFLEKMFSSMLPKGPKKLPISKMNFGGIGRKMIDYTMKSKNIESLEELLKNFIEKGGKIIACTMSMEVMGIKKDELIDGIEYGGVAAYIGETDTANHNLFI